MLALLETDGLVVVALLVNCQGDSIYFGLSSLQLNLQEDYQVEEGQSFTPKIVKED